MSWATNLIAKNIVAFDAREGVRVEDAAVGNRILTNSVFPNGGSGLDLRGNGPSFNDPSDPDTGPNNLQNVPAVSSAGAREEEPGTNARGCRPARSCPRWLGKPRGAGRPREGRRTASRQHRTAGGWAP